MTRHKVAFGALVLVQAAHSVEERDHHGDWKTPVEGLIEAKPHWPSYLTAQSVNMQALVNCLNPAGPRPSRLPVIKESDGSSSDGGRIP